MMLPKIAMPLDAKSQTLNSSSSAASVPVALTIAGSDCSGGAGIQADLKTFTALGVYGASVITALTAQNTVALTGIQHVDPGFVEQQFHAVMSDLRVGAIKTGMLGSANIVTAVSQCLKSHFDKEQAADQSRAPRPFSLIVDPVMVASSGGRLLDESAIGLMKSNLLPLADLVTPNLPEAAALLGCEPAASIGEMKAQAAALCDAGMRAVLLKGGHGSNAQAIDLLFDGQEMIEYAMPWVDTTNTHGTGCTLSSAIVAFIVRGLSLKEAVGEAKKFVWKALEHGRGRQVGHSCDALDHLHLINK